jgi:hypothetical protein
VFLAVLALEYEKGYLIPALVMSKPKKVDFMEKKALLEQAQDLAQN